MALRPVSRADERVEMDYANACIESTRIESMLLHTIKLVGFLGG
jgi:hypothetical protein